jgi:hypothetical protein
LLEISLIDPDQLPPPDVLDIAGRTRRVIAALAVGVAAGAAAFLICYGIVKRDGHSRGDANFVLCFTVFAGGGAFWLALFIQNYFATKKWHNDLVARAHVRKR